jgi:hypothetical protein
MTSLFHYDVLGIKKDLENILKQNHINLNLLIVKENNKKAFQNKFELFLSTITFLKDKINNDFLNELYLNMFEYIYSNIDYVTSFEILMSNLDRNKLCLKENIYKFWYERFYPYYLDEYYKLKISNMEETINNLKKIVSQKDFEIRNLQAGNQFLMKELEYTERAPFSPNMSQNKLWNNNIMIPPPGYK